MQNLPILAEILHKSGLAGGFFDPLQTVYVARHFQAVLSASHKIKKLTKHPKILG